MKKRPTKPARKAAPKVKSRKSAKKKPVRATPKAKPVPKKAAPKKVVKAKAQKEATSGKAKVVAPANGVLLGLIEDYFAKVGVIALTLKASLANGSKILVLGHTTRFEHVVLSMQIDHQPVAKASAGDGVGIQVTDRARRGDHVYLIP